jgi:Fe-Mn family superoxide dismutase
VPTLDNHVELQQNGVPGLLTAAGFNTAYTDYQAHMVEQLNESTAGMLPTLNCH